MSAQLGLSVGGSIRSDLCVLHSVKVTHKQNKCGLLWVCTIIFQTLHVLLAPVQRCILWHACAAECNSPFCSPSKHPCSKVHSVTRVCHIMQFFLAMIVAQYTSFVVRKQWKRFRFWNNWFKNSRNIKNSEPFLKKLVLFSALCGTWIWLPVKFHVTECNFFSIDLSTIYKLFMGFWTHFVEKKQNTNHTNVTEHQPIPIQT